MNNFKKIFKVFAFYFIAGLIGLIFIPSLIVIAPVFMISGVGILLLSIPKLINDLFQLNIEFFTHIILFNNMNFSPFVAFIITIILGITMIALGYGAWKLLKLYVNKVKEINKKISI